MASALESRRRQRRGQSTRTLDRHRTVHAPPIAHIGAAAPDTLGDADFERRSRWGRLSTAPRRGSHPYGQATGVRGGSSTQTLFRN